MGTFSRKLTTSPIRAYRRWVSPTTQQRCRYYPSCSAYAEEAITELGLFRGGPLAAWRLIRCNPLSHGGFDPVSARGRRTRSNPHTSTDKA